MGWNRRYSNMKSGERATYDEDEASKVIKGKF